jgi:hypothetical protein
MVENGEPLSIIWKPKYIKLLSRILNLVEKNHTRIIIVSPIQPHPKIIAFFKGIAEIRTEIILKSGSSNYLILNSKQMFTFRDLLRYIYRYRNELPFYKMLFLALFGANYWKNKKFESRAEIIARMSNVGGLISGSLHKPVIVNHKNLTLIEVGYWYRYSVALVETRENEWQFVYYGETGKAKAENPGVVIREVF